MLPWVWIGMAEIPPIFDVAWFVEHRSLHNDGEDVLSLTSVDDALLSSLIDSNVNLK